MASARLSVEKVNNVTVTVAHRRDAARINFWLLQKENPPSKKARVGHPREQLWIRKV